MAKNRITPIAVCFVDGGISSGPNFAIGRSLCDIDLNSLDFEALKSGRKSIGEIFRPGFELVKEFTQKNTGRSLSQKQIETGLKMVKCL